MQAGRGERRSLPFRWSNIQSSSAIIILFPWLPKCWILNLGWYETWRSDLHRASTAPVLEMQSLKISLPPSSLISSMTRIIDCWIHSPGLLRRSESNMISGPWTFSTIQAGNVRAFPVERPWAVTGIGGSSGGCGIEYTCLAQSSFNSRGRYWRSATCPTNHQQLVE